MGKRDKLEVKLAAAEADLTEAEAELVKAEADPASTTLDVARARCQRAGMRCNQIVAALTALNRAERMGKSIEETDQLIREALGDLELGTAARPSDRAQNTGSPQLSEHPVRNAEKPKAYKNHLNTIIGPLALARRKYMASSSGSDLRLLARQSLMLLALVLAYLQYYFADVHLQIALLPSLVAVSSLS